MKFWFSLMAGSIQIDRTAAKKVVSDLAENSQSPSNYSANILAERVQNGPW
jgi:hypothetical protein